MSRIFIGERWRSALPCRGSERAACPYTIVITSIYRLHFVLPHVPENTFLLLAVHSLIGTPASLIKYWGAAATGLCTILIGSSFVDVLVWIGIIKVQCVVEVSFAVGVRIRRIWQARSGRRSSAMGGHQFKGWHNILGVSASLTSKISESCRTLRRFTWHSKIVQLVSPRWYRRSWSGNEATLAACEDWNKGSTTMQQIKLGGLGDSPRLLICFHNFGWFWRNTLLGMDFTSRTLIVSIFTDEGNLITESKYHSHSSPCSSTRKETTVWVKRATVLQRFSSFTHL